MADPRVVDDRNADLGIARRAQTRLLSSLDAHLAEGDLDVTEPSRLPGWTKGHVLAHLVNSGDSHVRILEAAARGEVADQYPDGLDGRAADIESGAVLPLAEQVALLRGSCERLDRLWADAEAAGWVGSGTMVTGRIVAVAELPLLRACEVEIHHIDLDIGTEFENLPDDYVRTELRRTEMLWTARQPMGLTKLPAAALAAPPPRRLAWLMGRTTIDGLPPADVY